MYFTDTFTVQSKVHYQSKKSVWFQDEPWQGKRGESTLDEEGAGKAFTWLFFVCDAQFELHQVHQTYARQNRNFTILPLK